MVLEVNGFTHQEVPNKTYEEDQGEDKKSHSKGYPQDSCPKKIQYIINSNQVSQV